MSSYNYRFHEPETRKISITVPIGTISWVVWVVFMILYYGTHSIFQDLPEQTAVFWVWFPFWLPFALSGVFLVFALLCALILSGRRR